MLSYNVNARVERSNQFRGTDSNESVEDKGGKKEEALAYHRSSKAAWVPLCLLYVNKIYVYCSRHAERERERERERKRARVRENVQDVELETNHQNFKE